METTPYNSDSDALEQNGDGKNTEVTETPWTRNALTVFNNNREISLARARLAVTLAIAGSH